jgi:hypothetical protein
MSYHLARTEDNAKVKKAINEVQGVFDTHGKREWVEWVGKMLMPHLHMQIAMERVDEMRVEQDTMDEEWIQADEMRVEQDAMDEERIQAERVQREEEWAAKEAELDEKEEEYIWQLNAKEIDENKFRELVAELDLERAMGESIAEGLATTQVMTQDEDVRECEREEL